MMDLSLIWVGIIGLGVWIYVILDGFDLGIGILFPVVTDKQQRDVMMNTVAPVWDGKETWMVLGGAGLYAAFPLVYSMVLSALYLPIMFMLVALIVVWHLSFVLRHIVVAICGIWGLLGDRYLPVSFKG